MTIIKYAEFIHAHLQNEVIGEDTPIGVSRSLTSIVEVAPIRMAWVSPDGVMVVLSPLSLAGADKALALCSQKNITVAEFGHFLERCLQQGKITGNAIIGVFSHVASGEVHVAKAMDFFIPSGGDAVVVSVFVRQDIMALYGFDKPEKN